MRCDMGESRKEISVRAWSHLQWCCCWFIFYFARYASLRLNCMCVFFRGKSKTINGRKKQTNQCVCVLLKQASLGNCSKSYCRPSSTLVVLGQIYLPFIQIHVYVLCIILFFSPSNLRLRFRYFMCRFVYFNFLFIFSPVPA